MLLAWIQFLTPVANILLNSVLLGQSPWASVVASMESGAYSLFLLYGAMPAAGLAILAVRSWSYPVFLSAVSWVAFENSRILSTGTSGIPTRIAVGAYLCNIALVAYFLFPAVRTTYFNPRVRWWQTKPRYEIGLPATANHNGECAQVTIANMSEGGSFISTDMPYTSGDLLVIHFTLLGRRYTFRGRVVYQVKTHARRGVGLQFTHTTQTARENQTIIRALEVLDGPGRDLPRKGPLTFWKAVWATIRTGKGWLPEVPQSVASKPEDRDAA